MHTTTPTYGAGLKDRDAETFSDNTIINLT